MPPLPPPTPLPQSKPATQSTMRKNKKVQSVKASTVASSSLKHASTTETASPAVAPARQASISTPSTEGAYPSPSVSAYSSAGSAQPPLYESPNLASEFASSLFPPSHDQPPTTRHHESAPSPTDTIASVTSPSLVHPFLPSFEQPSISHHHQHSHSAPPASTAFANMYNPAMLQAHLNAAAQAGMVMAPQAMFNPQQPQPATSYLNNPAILYAMQQQYLAQHHHQQQQQQQQQHSNHSHSPASTSSPQSFGSFSQAGESSLWAGTPPSWPYSHQTPSAAVEGLF